tara:strand:- start:3357 stop:3623 length:267 start_codon:yes stop_codon:yes gene_type:complete
VQQLIFYILNENFVRPTVLNEQVEKSLEKIEAVISDLLRNSEDLSDVVAAQDKEISRIKDSLQWLLEQEFERQNIENTATAEKPPPHW